MQCIIARGAHAAYLDFTPNASSKPPAMLRLLDIASSSRMYQNVTIEGITILEHS